MKLTDVSVNRYITSIMMFIAIGALGCASFSKMPLDLYPDIEFPVAVVILQYPDVGPKEVESTVTRPIEETLASINNLDTITSTSRRGRGHHHEVHLGHGRVPRRIGHTGADRHRQGLSARRCQDSHRAEIRHVDDTGHGRLGIGAPRPIVDTGVFRSRSEKPVRAHRPASPPPW